MYLSWLADHATAYDADALAQRHARDWGCATFASGCCARGPAQRSPVYVNSVLAALNDFHIRRGLGKADVAREDLPMSALRGGASSAMTANRLPFRLESPRPCARPRG